MSGRLRMAWRWLIGAAVMGLAWWLMPEGGGEDGAWWAMPPLLAALATLGAEVILAKGIATVIFAGITVGHVIFVGAMLYGAYSAKQMRRRAKADYNASLTDRTVTVASSEAPWQIVYGEAVVGGNIAAILTSGDKDQYKHVVVVWAAHRCEAISDVLLNGQSIGALDSEGNVTGGKWLKGETRTELQYVTLNAAGQGTVSHPVTKLHSMAWGESSALPPYISFSGNTVQVAPEFLPAWAGQIVEVNYDWSLGEPMVRVRHHLGIEGEAADASLIGECPGDWTLSDVGQDLCYTVFRFNLNEPELQGGPPQMSAKVKGKRIYDPRTSSTAWSDNWALCVLDFIRGEHGKRALNTQIDWASFIAAANASDEALTSHPGQKRFTCNGALRTDQDPDQNLEQLCQAAAGFATFDGGWHIQAGVYTAPVMALTDADNLGSVDVVAGPQADEVFNGLRGKFYDPARYDQLTDYPPYQNAAFLAEDGTELWGDLNLPYTNTAWRAHNLARIQVERSRAMVVVFPAKMRAVRLRPGQRVLLSNSLLGMSEAIFRVVKREHALGRAVMLTLAQDDPSMYDEVDAPASLPSPAAYLPDPWQVDPVTGLTAASGNATLLRLSDGTVLGRVKLTYTASADAYVRGGGALEIEYRKASASVWQRAPSAAGDSTEAYLLGLDELQLYLVRARWRNALGAASDWRTVSVWHTGKSEPPSNVTGFAASPLIGGALLSWDSCTDADYRETVLRVGPTWDHASTEEIWRGAANNYAWAALDGTYNVMARHMDKSDNLSLTTAAIEVVVVNGINTAGLVLDISSQAFLVPATSSGVVVSYTGAAADVRVLAGGSDDTENWTLARTDGAGVTTTFVDGLLTLTALATGTDVSYIDVTATRTGYATLTKRLMVAKVKAGATGTNGTNGEPGRRTAEARVYKWATSIPAGPTGTSTYTWASGAIDTPPSGWTLTPATPFPGWTLYAATVRLTNTGTTATDTVDWTTAGVAPVGAAGPSGVNGSDGTGARVAYTVIASGSTLGTGTRTSSGSASVPATNAWGGSETWQATAPSYGTNQTVWQTYGSYNPSTGVITWDSPFISALKVGQLSAISANLGTINAGDINGVTITGGLIRTAASGQRIVLNESGGNTGRFYGNDGSSLILAAELGLSTYYSVTSVLRAGSYEPGSTVNGAFLTTGSNAALIAQARTGTAVSATSLTGTAVTAVTANNSSLPTINATSVGGNALSAYTNGAYAVLAWGPPSAANLGAIMAHGGVSIGNSGMHDPYGYCSVTRPNDSFSYSYFSMTRMNQQPWGMGIDTSNRLAFGIPSPGHQGKIASVLFAVNTAGSGEFAGILKVTGGFGCNGKSPQSAYTLPAAATDLTSAIALANALRTMSINNGIGA